MVATEILIAVVTALVSYLFIQWYKNPLRKIPGPTGLPLLGNALQIDVNKMHMGFYELAQQYGPVMKISLFTDPIVVINTSAASIEALIKRGTDFQGRPNLFRIQSVVRDDVAFTSFDKPNYQLLRRVATKALRSYGAGVAKLENVIQENMQEVIDLLMAKDGKPVDAHEVCYGFVCCVMATILFGEKYSYDDPVCKEIHLMNDDVVNCSSLSQAGAIIDIYPILAKFEFLFPECFKLLRKTHEQIDGSVVKRIEQFKAAYDPNHKHGCLDYFIEALSQEKDENGNSMNQDRLLIGLVIDFCVGGMETTLAGLSQSLLELASDKKLQKQLQSEVDTVIGHKDKPSLHHRESMHLMESFTHETLRYLSQVPFLLPHMTIRDTEVAGYKIPAKTKIFFNAFYAAHNPDVYEDPFKFKADRFLDNNGQLVLPDHPLRRSFLGFGAGRRQCPGELLGRSRIFLLLAAIMQRFDLEMYGEIPCKDVRQYNMRTIIDPPKLEKMRFVPRHY